MAHEDQSTDPPDDWPPLTADQIVDSGGLLFGLERTSLSDPWPDLDPLAERIFTSWQYVCEVGVIETIQRLPDGAVHRLRARPSGETVTLEVIAQELRTQITVFGSTRLFLEVPLPGFRIEMGQGETPTTWNGVWLSALAPPGPDDGEWRPPGFTGPEPDALPRPKPPGPHPTQKRPLAAAPNDRAHQALELALARPAQDWKTNPEERQKYFENRGVTVIFRPEELCGELIGDHALRLLETRFARLSNDLVADVIDIAYLHWLNNGRPPKARITLSQTCEYRNVLATSDSLKRHWQAWRDARSLRLSDAAIDAAVLEVDTARLPQLNLFGLDDPPSADLILVYSPGAFIAAALATNRGYLADYITKTLSLDPYTDRLAKRLGRYLRGEWRMNPDGYLPGRPKRYRTWRDHLADAGIEPGEYERSTKFRAALERDLVKLWNCGALDSTEAGRSERDWLDGLIHPEDRKIRLPRYHWLETYLSLRVHLPPPRPIQQRLADISRKRAGQLEQQKSLAAARPKGRRAKKSAS